MRRLVYSGELGWIGGAVVARAGRLSRAAQSAGAQSRGDTTLEGFRP